MPAYIPNSGECPVDAATSRAISQMMKEFLKELEEFTKGGNRGKSS